MSVRWHTDEPEADFPEWYGWTDEQNMREDEPRYVVKHIAQDDIWGGWVISVDGEQACVTHDHGKASGARAEVEAVEESSRNG